MNVVVGGGISGLIWCLYHPKSCLYAKTLGGQLSEPWMGPRLLHECDSNRRFLRDMGLPAKEAQCLIGYLIDGTLIGNCPGDMRKNYYLKSRGLDDSDIVPDSIMSDGSNILRHLDISWELLLQKLKKKVPSHMYFAEDVSSIDIENGIFNGNKRFDTMTWTPPLPILFKILGLEAPQFEGLDKKFVLVKNFKDFNLQDFDYVYVPGDQYSYHRVTKAKCGIVLEWTGLDPQPDLSSYDVLREETVKGIQLKPTESDPYDLGIPKNIRLFGRFAEWKHKIKIEDTIMTALRCRTQSEATTTTH